MGERRESELERVSDNERLRREQGHSREDVQVPEGESARMSGGGGGSPVQHKNRRQEKTGRSSDALERRREPLANEGGDGADGEEEQAD